MLVDEFLDLCRTTVWKQLEHLDDFDGIGYLNQAMVQLYKKFDINKQEQVISLITGTTTYTLNADYLIWVSAKTTQNYLRDFQGNIIIGGDAAKKVNIPVNDPTDPNAMVINTVRTAKFQYPTTGQDIDFLYRAAPVKILAEDGNQELILEPQYIEPLMHYVGYLGYLGLNVIGGESDSLLAQFNLACSLIIQDGIAPHEQYENTKLNDRGFV